MVQVDCSHEEDLLLVETRTEYPPGAQLLRYLAGFLPTGRRDYTGLSNGAIYVQYADRLRRVRRRAARAEIVTREFTIDGRPEPFAFARVDDVWVAAREHSGVTVHLVGFQVDPARIMLAPLPGVGNAPEPPSVELLRRAAAGHLLARAEVAELIDAHDLGEYRDTILDSIRPGYRLKVVAASPHRIGGLPDLAPGEQWPHEDGMPYTFVVQIDCSQLPPLESDFAVPEFNHDGQLLRFFAPMDGQMWEPGFAVALACPPDAPLTRTQTPPCPDALPAHADDESLREFEEEPVQLLANLYARHPSFGRAPGSLFDAYDAFRDQLAAGGVKPREDRWPDAQLLGHATNVQGSDPVTYCPLIYEETDVSDWCLLLNLPALVDFGAVAILIRRDDLAAGRYDRLATDKSMG
jgi:hypothetical protein